MLAGLRADLTLQRVAQISVELNSDSTVHVTIGDNRLFGGVHGLRVLNDFERPRTVRAAIESSGVLLRRKRDWLDFVNTIVSFYHSGVLVTPTNLRPRAVNVDAHVQMLGDVSRTSSFIHAIRRVVNAGDVVLDIGTGTGVLAVAAAQAGARRVYAVEAGPIANMAEAIIRANGVTEQVIVIKGRSTQVDLPEFVDVMICELIGDSPLDEGLLSACHDGVERFLRPGARIVPSSIRLLCLLVEIPAQEISRYSMQKPAVCHWQRLYGIDFSPLQEVVDMGIKYHSVSTYDVRDWKVLSEPIELQEFDLSDRTQSHAQGIKNVLVVRPGIISAIVLYFEARLCPEICLSSHPSVAQVDHHWRSPLWLVEPVSVREGDMVRLGYSLNCPDRSDAIELDADVGIS